MKFTTVFPQMFAVLVLIGSTAIAATANLSFGQSCASGAACLYSGATENQTVSASCSAGTIVASAATYGVGTKTESCLNYAASHCNGLSSCSLVFSNGNCGGDPDFGVVKSASLALSCSNTQQSFGGTCSSGSTCSYAGAVENSTARLACAAGTITIKNSIYGQGSKTESCQTYAASQCNGKNTCSLVFSNSNCSGDPDFGIVKAGSATISCSSSAPPPSSGICGSANGVSVASAPTSNLCSSGTTPGAAGTGPFTWTCSGSNGGSNASCSAPLLTFTVTPSVANVGISPNSAQNIKSGTKQSFTVSANTGFTLSSTVGGTCPAGSWSGSTYTTGAVTANCTVAFTATANVAGGVGLETPGPSQALFSNPYYQCSKNFYVSTSGSDSTGNGSAALPWASLQKATNANTGAGSCINIAPGAYDGVQVINGGSSATRTGYVVFRCTTMDACTLNGNAGVNGTAAIMAGYCSSNGSYSCPANASLPSYVMFDGFVLAGPGASDEYYSSGLFVGYLGGAGLGPHHFWLLNSTISNFGEAGVQTSGNDFVYLMHNTIYNNTSYTCGGAQGSGISFILNYQPPGYVPTTDDKTGAAPYFGFKTWVVGSSYFHTVAAYNVIHNNNSQCGAESDHNGIIYDITSGSGNPNGSYDQPQLAYGNVIYNNAGGGVHVFAADNVTVANNSVFNNGTLSGYGQAQIDDMASTSTYPNSFYNNISVSCTTAASGVVAGYNNNAAMFLAPASGTDVALNNITLMASNLSSCLWGYFSTYGASNGEWVSVNDGAPDSSNKLSTNPNWANVSFAQPGTQLIPPVSTNFALSPGSPAINGGIRMPWMPTTATDAGACPSQLTSCP